MSLAVGLKQYFACDFVEIQPKENFYFPWKINNFFRVFPRCVRGLAPEIEPIQVCFENYDLIILGYQVWFLSPSLPIQGFLSSTFASALKDKKVLTLSTCRNLHLSASSTMRRILQNIGAHHVGEITICEKSPLWASFVTTPRWMLTGSKSAFAFFPEAGISNAEFKKLEQKGEIIGKYWNDIKGQDILYNAFGCNLNRISLQLMDKIGYRFFLIWSALILKLAAKPGVWQDFLLLLFRINLFLLIVTVAPLTKIYEIIVTKNLFHKWRIN